jgi:AraC family transcriptional regulator of adaptative response/methylated-DNA-[protein]-cysteine methyltransferase
VERALRLGRKRVADAVEPVLFRDLKKFRISDRIGAMEITYTIADCRLGKLLVASSEKGLRMVSIGDSAAELERKLHDELRNEDVRRDDRAMKAIANQVKDRIEGKGLDKKMPLDLRGTQFQMSVWKEMLRIPAGSTKSYAEVAKKIGKPNAYRAVANACGSNPVPIVVPCHRVVASGGKLGGFGLGIERKVSLLAAEGVHDQKWQS